MLYKNWLSGPKIILFAFIISTLTHLPFLNLGPRSVHVWRQSNTLAVAKNFYTEKMDILNPRVDRRLNTNGVTGMQFPSYEYLVAIGYKIVGFHNWVHRIISLIISFWGALGMYFLAKYLIRNEIAAGFSALAYTFSPDLYYFGFSALPDILALACSIWGLYYFLTWFQIPTNISTNTNTDKQLAITNYQSATRYLLALIFITIAGLTKLQFLAIGFFIAPLIFIYADVAKKKIPHLIILGVTTCLIPLLWYKRSVELIKSSGLADFGITFRPESSFNKGINTILQNIISDLPDLLLNYASFIVFFYSIFLFFQKKFWKSKWFIPMLSYSLALICYHIIELAQMDVHSYYMMPYFPILFLMIAYGIANINLTKKSNYLFVLFLIFTSPILASVRIIPSRWINSNPGIPIELYNEKSRLEIINSIEQNNLCIIGPDVSGCIYFYHLNQKGFGFDNVKDLNLVKSNRTLLEEYVEMGATYLISNDENIMEINKLDSLFFLKNKVGSFYIFKLKSN